MQVLLSIGPIEQLTTHGPAIDRSESSVIYGNVSTHFNFSLGTGRTFVLLRTKSFRPPMQVPSALAASVVHTKLPVTRREP